MKFTTLIRTTRNDGTEVKPAVLVRLPRSVHAAMLAEAKAEDVSLNQLCVAKLVAQLRAVV
jgi:predicted HicB family RNase H-like nuclease